jgi:cyclopropane-fatty-acyl-phospholipid synthase
MSAPIDLGRPEVLTGLPRALRAMLAMLARIDCGEIAVTVPDGRTFRACGPRPGPQAALIIHRERAVRRLMLGGSVGFGESYMDGDWETPDLAALLEFGDRNQAHLNGVHAGGSTALLIARRLWHVFNANTRRGSKRNIAYHYDLGNHFYSRWLDQTMTYSCALFARPDADLAEAQRAKYDAIADKLALAPDRRVLEIGCGWGGFASFAARERQARVTAITISREQLDFVCARIQREGLNERVEARLVDYRDLSGKFDAIASIEMFEAVGEKYWPAFFNKVSECLEPGGRAALQIITISDRWFDSYRKGVDFIQRYIFPGGMLPSPTALVREAERAGLTVDRQEFYGAHYARTLGEWHERFRAAWPDIAPLGFDARFRRMWEFYLAYCQAGFRSGSIDLTQIALVRE